MDETAPYCREKFKSTNSSDFNCLFKITSLENSMPDKVAPNFSLPAAKMIDFKTFAKSKTILVFFDSRGSDF